MDKLDFGSIYHVDGEPVVILSEHPVNPNFARLGYPDGSVGWFFKFSLDEFMPDPAQKRREELLSLWKMQDLEYAHDTEDSRPPLNIVLLWLEENKDAIRTILTP